ncbi:hypothetical protein CTI12_AA147340 [Artemisia annua]|uniref:Uncharacterized protein n=1 Tax=Artemisia annua TaxID=35608 RepID=A0A2U1NRH2_ARTAN|nr:hypothetical protein CTI12_AA147340 [Artemisia annua]
MVKANLAFCVSLIRSTWGLRGTPLLIKIFYSQQDAIYAPVEDMMPMGAGYGRGENGSFVRGVQGPYADEISTAGLIAAQAVSALQIADDEDINTFVFNRMSLVCITILVLFQSCFLKKSLGCV